MTRDDITIETVDTLIDASLAAYANRLSGALSDAASGPDRIWDWFDARPSEAETSGRILDEELDRILPAVRDLLAGAMLAAMTKIAAELPTAPMRAEQLDVLVDEVRARRVPPARAA